MMKVRNILYIILMFIFIVFAYLFFDRGFNVKTKVYVTYQEKSSLIYKVGLFKNDIYDKEYLNMNERYITNLVDDIIVELDYNELFNRNLSGYYTYQVINTLVGYTDDINESVFKKEDTILEETKVLNQNDLKEIIINKEFTIDYDKYLKALKEYKEEYKLDLSGYLETKIVIKENLDFFNSEKITEDEKEMKLIIPLSYETFKINIDNDNNRIGSYYDYSKKEKLNYIFLIIGAFSLAMGISFLALTIRNMIKESRDEVSYRKELKRIISENSNILVNVKKFYSKHKYNLIYVASFEELMDAYRRVESPISYKEIKKNEETIFLMIDDDSAWIYRLVKK